MKMCSNISKDVTELTEDLGREVEIYESSNPCCR